MILVNFRTDISPLVMNGSQQGTGMRDDDTSQFFRFPLVMNGSQQGTDEVLEQRYSPLVMNESQQGTGMPTGHKYNSAR